MCKTGGIFLAAGFMAGLRKPDLWRTAARKQSFLNARREPCRSMQSAPRQHGHSSQVRKSGTWGTPTLTYRGVRTWATRLNRSPVTGTMAGNDSIKVLWKDIGGTYQELVQMTQSYKPLQDAIQKMSAALPPRPVVGQAVRT